MGCARVASLATTRLRVRASIAAGRYLGEGLGFCLVKEGRQAARKKKYGREKNEKEANATAVFD